MACALVPFADGLEEIEALSVVDVLRRGGVEVVTAAIGDGLLVQGAHGVVISADRLLSELDGYVFDAIVLPGGGQGTANLKSSPAVISALRRHKDEGRLVCAICAAPTVLVAAGILDENQHLTCYPTCAGELDRPRAEAPVVEDGNLITGEGPGAALLFALVVLKALAGEGAARQVASGMVTDLLG